MTSEPQNQQPKDNRVRLGPIAMAALEDAPDQKQRSMIIETLFEQNAALEEQLKDARNQLKQLNRFDDVFAQMTAVLATVAESLDSQSELLKQRYIKHDRLHLRTRLLLANSVTQGSEREQIFKHFDHVVVGLQAHIKALEVTDAEKAQARRNEEMRMQQLLTEAGAQENNRAEQIEMDGLEPGGTER